MNRLTVMDDKEFRFLIIEDLLRQQREKRLESIKQKDFDRAITHLLVIARLNDWRNEIMLDMEGI